MEPGHMEPGEQRHARGCEPGRQMPGGAPQRPREEHYPGGSRRPKKGKPGRRIEGTWWSMSGPAGTSGPVRDAILSGQMGSTAEAQGDTTPEEEAVHQPLTRAWSEQLEPGWVESREARPGQSAQGIAAAQAAGGFSTW
jgi:hypothetical protein